ncbi:MAG: AmpG family muropeptide MFS transporter [Acidobacteriia bacterium]|nr:AmpG family muropeptide MFS transporter [Terriglobia bacterium]
MATRPPVHRVVFSARMLAQLLAGFSSGLPLLLTGSTLQAWLKDERVDLGAIGLFALVGLPYTLKFFWSPLLDRYVPPFLGRRRGWMLLTQLAVAAAIAGVGLSSPAVSPSGVAVLALALTFASASQDIVLDAYRREALEEVELGFGTSVFVSGYRLAMLVSGALALALADRVPWRSVYFLMAGLMSVGVVTALLCREPVIDAPPPRSLRDAVVEPFVDFFRRRRAWLILAFIVLYKVGDQMASAMTTPFVLDLGFSKTELAAVVKVFGLVSMICGGLVGGIVMLKLGIRRSLWAFGILQALSVLAFAALAQAGRIYGILAGAVSLENFSFGMGAAAYSAYMASQTNKRFTATQFALFSSLTGIPRVLAAAPTGFLAKALGWTGFFTFCAAAAIPGLVLLLWVAPWREASSSPTD